MFSAKNIDAMTKVKNTGNTDFLAVYDLTVKSIFGTPIYANSDNFIVLPGTERKFSTSWAEAPLFGIFNVSFTVNALDQSRTDSHVILILPAFMVVIALLLGSLCRVAANELRVQTNTKNKKASVELCKKARKNFLGFSVWALLPL